MSVSGSKVLISSLSESALEFLMRVFNYKIWFFTSPCPPISTKRFLAQERIIKNRLNLSLKFGKLSMFWIMFPEATDSLLMISNVMAYFELRFGTCSMFNENINDSSKNSFFHKKNCHVKIRTDLADHWSLLSNFKIRTNLTVHGSLHLNLKIRTNLTVYGSLLPNFKIRTNLGGPWIPRGTLF